MDDRHLTRDLLWAIHRGERSPGELAAVAMAHLFALCPSCRRTFERWRREYGEEGAGPSLGGNAAAPERMGAHRAHGGPSGARARPPAAEAAPAAGVEAGEATARDRVRELLALPAAERAERVRRQPGRYGGPVLAELLLAEAREHLPGEPREAYAAAGLARAVLQHASATPHAVEIYGRALAHQANALRAQGELRPASELLEVARFFVEHQTGGSRSTRAELDSFEGSLRWAQRRFDEAEGHFSRAVAAYLKEDRPVEAARNLLPLAMVHRQRDRLERAIEVASQAERMLETHGEARLLLMARHNLARYHLERGDLQEARSVLAASRGLYERFPDAWTRLRRLWLEAHLARAEGRSDEAESAYGAVRDGFLAEGVGYDAALAALDLAFLYAEQGRVAELKRLAEGLVPAFEAQDVHREAAAALMLFRDAVRAERVTLRYLSELSRYLERARLDPALAFRQPI